MSENLIVREIKKEELETDLLKHFNRYQKVVNVWRIIDGVKTLVKNPFIESWDNEVKRKVVDEDFAHSINDGGVVFGAFNGDKLIAFAVLLHDFFGSQKQYVQLKQLHVSNEYRGLGLGKRLFDSCVRKAREWDAKKLYISGHSAEETQGFYARVGCVDAQEINEELATLEPYDVQLEYEII